MSKFQRLFPPSFMVAVLIGLFCKIAPSQELEATFKVEPNSNRIEVEGRFLRDRPGRNGFLYLMSEYGPVKELDERISNVRAFDTTGKNLPLLRIGDSYASEAGEISAWSYTIDLSPIEKTTAASHTSWLDKDRGVLMIDDLLPQELGRELGFDKRGAIIKLDLPAEWKTISTEKQLSKDRFQIVEVEKTAFVVGRYWREKNINVAGADIKLLMSGEWAFNEDDALLQASEVFTHYVSLFGAVPRSHIQIAIYRFPFPVPAGEWEADARGGCVTIASSDMPFKSQSLQRLHEQLRHELFHLWIPSGVNLLGDDWAWFYEGFALYQSLKLGVSANRIRFDDMLDTLSRAYTFDHSVAEKTPLKLADRWNGSNTRVYARGMLIAFVTDLTLLDASSGKLSTDDLLRQFYNDFKGPNVRLDGTAAITGSFYRHKHKQLRQIVDGYVDDSRDIDWRPQLSAAGLEEKLTGRSVKLTVVLKPNGRQKKILDKLVYNNWRKLSKGNQ